VLTVVPDAAAPDLDDDDAHTRYGHDEVGLVVLALVRDAEAGHEQVVAAELVAKQLR
jgi:hypothetical protein